MNTKLIRTLIKKELLDVFRDKKTVIMMLVVPVIIYPLIFIGAMQVVAAISSSMDEQNYRIAVEAEDDGAFLQALTKKGEETDEDDDVSYQLTIYDVQNADDPQDYMTKLREEEIDAYVIGTMQDGKMRYDVYYLSSVSNSSYAGEIVMDALEDYREEMTKNKILQAGLHTSDILEHIHYEKKDRKSSQITSV